MIAKSINQYTVGWINYFGIGQMKSFIEETAHWFNHRLRQLCWKRWKKVITQYKMLIKYGIEHEEAYRYANTRKGYWRISRSQTIHRALKKEKLIKWGLKDINHLYQLRYSSC